jgi:hypothetical protein
VIKLSVITWHIDHTIKWFVFYPHSGGTAAIKVDSIAASEQNHQMCQFFKRHSGGRICTTIKGEENNISPVS